jgi:hypothetical protein
MMMGTPAVRVNYDTLLSLPPFEVGAPDLGYACEPGFGSDSRRGH